MGTKKLSAIWHIATAGRSLEAKMKLVIFLQRFYVDVVEDLETTATEAGQLHTLQALRAIVEDKLEKNGKL